MNSTMRTVNEIMETINAVLWNDVVLYIILGTGLLFFIWSKGSPFISLIHGFRLLFSKTSKDESAPGVISHFQALSAALSATVGLGNIGGVAVAVSLGGPGAVFWMWIVGFIGMAIKTTEVTQSMIYRNTADKSNPHGGPMYVISKGLAARSPRLAKLGSALGGLFCVTLIVSAVTGGNMFQAWNVAKVTNLGFGLSEITSGVIMAIICGLVIVGGIKRIGSVAGFLVPFMCGLYLLAALYVLFLHAGEIPGLFSLIFHSAFNPVEAKGAFIGGSIGSAFLFGMKRALFSNESGQGSSPIAHSAVKTAEPASEGIVAGLEPFIDTLVVCTLTALVVLVTGVWNRTADFEAPFGPEISEVSPGLWKASLSAPLATTLPGFKAGQDIYGVVNSEDGNLSKIYGTLVVNENKDYSVNWNAISANSAPQAGIVASYFSYEGAAMTSFAFDQVHDGFGKWLVTIASWLFAISTVISWSYYGEQGIIYLMGEKMVTPYRIVYCLLIIVATSGWINTDQELDNLTGIGTGLMLFVNIPIMLLFGKQAMDTLKDYLRRTA